MWRLLRPAVALLAVMVLSTQASAATLVLAPVYFSKSADRLSFLRLVNPGTTAGSVSVVIKDENGASLGTWRKDLPANTALQFGVETLEREANIAPQGLFGRLEVTPTFNGFAQHVIYNPAGGALTNVSPCGADIATDDSVLGGVHTSLLSSFPSNIVIHNRGTAGTAVVDVYDALDGAKKGTWTTPAIPRAGTLTTPVAQIQSAIGFTPTGAQLHLMLKLKSGFTGGMTNLVDNLTAGVLTDMTARCALRP